jgi:hypothetical protein
MRLTRHGQPWLRPGTRPPDVTSPPAVYEPGPYAAEWERLGRLRDRAVEGRGSYSMASNSSNRRRARRKARGQLTLELGP